jgi:translation initiation factor IF-3
MNNNNNPGMGGPPGPMERPDRNNPQSQQQQQNRGPRINRMIRISPIRVIGPEGDQIGVLETQEALRMAEEQGLDLVEVSPNARPPVCRIMDYGKYKYDQAKRLRKSRAASKSAEMKQIRLGRSVKIDDHDVQIRINQTRKFLLAGHKVQVTQRFRGREIVHKDLGLERLVQVAEALSDISKVEVSARWAGRQASIIVAPDKNASAAALAAAREKERLVAQTLGTMSEDDLDVDDDDDDDDDELEGEAAT